MPQLYSGGGKPKGHFREDESRIQSRMGFFSKQDSGQDGFLGKQDSYQDALLHGVFAPLCSKIKVLCTFIFEIKVHSTFISKIKVQRRCQETHPGANPAISKIPSWCESCFL